MRGSTKQIQLRSWIPPNFAWSYSADIFGIQATFDDHAIVEFIATGTAIATIQRSRKQTELIAALFQSSPFTGQLMTAAWPRWKRSAKGTQSSTPIEVQVYCHGAFCLPGEKEMLILAGLNAPAATERWLPQSTQNEALVLLKKHQAKIAEFEEEIRRKEKDNEEFYARMPEMPRFGDIRLALESAHPPVLTAEPLRQLMPKASFFSITPDHRTSAMERAAIAGISDSGWRPSRDGDYLGLFPIIIGSKRFGLVTWKPHEGLPPYPEVRWAIQRRLPRALKNPRIEHLGADQNLSPAFNPPRTRITLSGLISMGRILNGQTDSKTAYESSRYCHWPRAAFVIDSAGKISKLC